MGISTGMIELTAEREVLRGDRIQRDLIALALIGIALFGALSLIAHDLGRIPNWCGPLGAGVANALNQLLGLQSYLVLVFGAGLGIAIWAGAQFTTIGRAALGGTILLAALSAGASLAGGDALQMGGVVGATLAEFLEAWVSVGGGLLAVMFVVLMALTIILGRAPTDVIAAASHAFRRRSADTQAAQVPGDPLANWAEGIEATALDPDDSSARIDDAEQEEPRRHSILRSLTLGELAGRSAKPAAAASMRNKSGYRLPPLALLDAPPLERHHVDEDLLERSARLLEQKLIAFNVEGRVVEVQPGPVVTMYKFEPAAGIKVSQIVNLADDLSMALKALSVRILAPVPGEAVVGIEVPNRKREKVYLREILEADAYRGTQSQLTIALGKDTSGQPAAADLAQMPHLLIAGATGTGKSVAIHAMIAAILFNATADDVRFILIDPKMLELSVYENIPHLLVPVVVDLSKAAAALLWATREMENRYRMMRDMGVRNIDGYNAAVAGRDKPVELKPRQMVGAGQTEGEQPIEHRKLPKIVIVIDELADLLLNEGKSVERDITRLAQKARAAGIHLILATQRPSVDVITGLIKANLPARISFQVTSRVDSRTILDSIGAERLLGNGDMLFMPPGTAKLRRLHGPFVSEGEIRKVTDFLRAQGAPEYEMKILETATEEDAGGGAGFEQDEMYDEAVRIVIEANQASISMIQRRLRIGYNRAARMVEQMEREGLVLPADGARPREVRGMR